MINQLYLEGFVEEGYYYMPSSSAAVLFVLVYCQTKSYNVMFVLRDVTQQTMAMKFPVQALKYLHTTVVKFEDLAVAVKQCSLPAVRTTQSVYDKVLSGLSCVVRNIIKQADREYDASKLINLLSHKEICLKACAEVSSWTKFCEVEMPTAVDCFANENQPSDLHIIPVELLRLENQFEQPVVVANISKRRNEMKKLARTQQVTLLKSSEGLENTAQLQHDFVEGADMTVADLVLFPLVMSLWHFLQEKIDNIQAYLPLCVAWCRRLHDLPKVNETFIQCQLPAPAMLSEGTVNTLDKKMSYDMQSFLPVLDSYDPHIRTAKSKKFKASAVEITKAMDHFQNAVEANTIKTCCDASLPGLPWEDFPDSVTPKEELPKVRLARKCQQLENLAKAVVNIARPGQTVVDFCSGGGHLGILLAHLLPDCKVVLIENKEESIERAENRILKLNLENITIYQCNLDYFQGNFDIGTCLHACGVATDLVLQCCLDNSASFVICPCCYGYIQNTHTMSYPRSSKLRLSKFSYKDYIFLGHGADQTQFNTATAEKGKQCMNYIDTDRALLAQEKGYDVTCSTLQPPECSPKNNLLVGVRKSSF